MSNLTKEQVEQKVVSYAKGVDWDFEKVKDYINYKIGGQSYRLLDGAFSKDKAQIIIDKYKPKEEVILPEKWCVKNEGQQELRDWVLSRADFDTSYIVDDYGLIVSDGYDDMSYQYWCDADYIEGYETISFEQFKTYVLGEGTTVKPVEKVFTITREALGEIYEHVCPEWQRAINIIISANPFKNEFEVGEDLVNKARCEKFLNSVQREWLDKYFPKPKKKKIELVVGLGGRGEWGEDTGYKHDLSRYEPQLLDRDYCEYEVEYYDLIWCETSEGLSCLFLGRWNDGVSTDED